jgi:predicted nuclease of predicted toxin-antitoxin system
VRRNSLAAADDLAVFSAAAGAGDIVIVTTDADFVELLDRRGPPPQVLWLTFGDTSTAAARTILGAQLPAALALLREGEALVENSAPA